MERRNKLWVDSIISLSNIICLGFFFHYFTFACMRFKFLSILLKNVKIKMFKNYIKQNNNEWRNLIWTMIAKLKTFFCFVLYFQITEYTCNTFKAIHYTVEWEFVRTQHILYTWLGHVKLIIWFSDTDFQKNDEGGRVFNFCIYMHIGPIFGFHFIDCYHLELLEVTTSFNQRKTQECSEFLQREIGVVSLWSIQVKRNENLNADFFTVVFIFVWW